MGLHGTDFRLSDRVRDLLPSCAASDRYASRSATRFRTHSSRSQRRSSPADYSCSFVQRSLRKIKGSWFHLSASRPGSGHRERAIIVRREVIRLETCEAAAIEARIPYYVAHARI